MTDTINLSLQEVKNLALEVLLSNSLGKEHAECVADVIVAGERDACTSHGLYRLIVCTHTLRSGKVNKTAIPEISTPASSVVVVDAKQGYSLLPFKYGMAVAAERAKQNGIAALAIRNCVHFSALWPEVEAIAQEGLAALALTPSHSWVAPAGGTRPLFGTNPIAFSWPRPNGNPYVFDLATSAITRGDIELHKRSGTPLPANCALDSDGIPTTDPNAAIAGSMLTFGGYKGSAISTMIELMAGPLIGDMMSFESLAYDNGVGASPTHGELILLFSPNLLGGEKHQMNQERAEQLFDAMLGQGARLPSQRRFEARERSLVSGVNVSKALFEDVRKLII